MSDDVIPFAGSSDVNATLPETEVTAKRDPPAADESPTANKLFPRAWIGFGAAGRDGRSAEPGGRTAPSSVISIGSDRDDKTQGGGARSRTSISSSRSRWARSNTPWKMHATGLVSLVAGYQIKAKSSGQSGCGWVGAASAAAILSSRERSSGLRGKENATDTFLRIYANAFDLAINNALVNTTLPKGNTPRDVVQACIDAINQEKDNVRTPMDLGDVSAFGDKPSPRTGRSTECRAISCETWRKPGHIAISVWMGR